MKRLLLLIVLCLSCQAAAQNANTFTVRFAGVPSGPCSVFMLGVNNAANTEYNCGTDGLWHLIGTGGSGTVTSVSGTANQIDVATGTTTPVISIDPTFTFPGTVTNNLSIFGATTSAQLAGIISNETGTGLLVFATNPALTTPDLGTPSAATLTNATGLPISSGVSGLGTGVATFLATPSSANLATTVTDETGSGALVFGTAPTITLANGTALPISTGVSGLGTGVATFLATPSSANLISAVTDETGTGSLVFSASPTFTGTLSAATITATSNVAAGATNSIQFTGRSRFVSGSDGVLTALNNGGSSFTRLGLGGTSSSFVALCSATTVLTICLGDGTAGGTLAVPTLQATTSATIGGGTPILKVLSSTATLDFGNLAAIGCEDLTITVTGAALGDTVSIGVPNGSVPGTTAQFTGWVSATNTVTIRYCDLVSGNPASGTFRATVTQF